MNHCENNGADREFGATIETEFLQLLSDSGIAGHRMQENRERNSAKIYVCGEYVIAPDIATWRPGRSTLHEIKGKYPTARGEFGLEEYRLRHYERLAEKVPVYYSIKICVRDESKNRDKARERIMDLCPEWADKWVTINMRELFNTGRRTAEFSSWVNGRKEDNVPQIFWPIKWWTAIDWVQLGKKVTV